ncbi:MAG: alpha-amylase family glycosyl hydrolase [Candidatus Eisenbacteria bacterium]
MPRTLIPLLTCAALFASGLAIAATPDGNVEWNGLSHTGWQDRRPLCPVSGESFQVRFQTYRDDITSARIGVTVSGVTTWYSAAVVGSRSLYDVWATQVPATAAPSESYVIEVSDGADTDYLSASGVSDGLPIDGGFALDFTTLAHAPVGATRVSGGGAVFKVWAPTRVSALVRGDFNGWGTTNALSKVGEHFIGRVNGVADRAQYKYYFNNAVWNTDARARSLNASASSNAHIEDPFRFIWTSDAFRTPDAESLVVYQLHVGTFSGRNDPLGSPTFPGGYRAVGDRVGHLVELGVNAVQICPVTEFPGDLSAGYNPQTQWAPEWKYGTPDDLKYMVDKLHARGIAVIMDIVWNHFTTNDNFMWNYDGSQTYFDSPQVDTPWGAQADFDKVAVRDYYANSALLWLEEYRLDGFRMDATGYMDMGQPISGWQLMQRLNDEVDRSYGDRIVVAEQLPNDASITTSTAAGGAGFDAQYHQQFRDAVRNAIQDAAFGNPSMSAVRNALLGSGATISGRRAWNYFQLHDEAWPSSGGQRFVKNIDTSAPYDDLYAMGRMKLAMGLLLTAPGVPVFLQGDEWLEDTDFGSDALNRIDWSKKTTYRGIFDYHQRLISLRRTLAPLRASAPVLVFKVDDTNNVLAFRRTAPNGDPIIVVAYFGNTPLTGVRIGVPELGEWRELANSQDPAFLGSGPVNGTRNAESVTADGFVQSLVLDLPAMALTVLAPQRFVGAPVKTPSAVMLELATPWPNPATGTMVLGFTLPRAGNVSLAVLDLAGREVARPAMGAFGSGPHTVRWDGRSLDGAALPAGLYFVRLTTADGVRTARVTHLE